MSRSIRLKNGVLSHVDPKVMKSDYECECARRGLAISKAVKNKGEWNKCTHHFANGRLIAVVMKGERPNWKQMLEDLK